jgi:hypothetical protein
MCILTLGPDSAEEPITTLVEGCQLLEMVILAVYGSLTMLTDKRVASCSAAFRPGVKVAIEFEESYDEDGDFMQEVFVCVHAERITAARRGILKFLWRQVTCVIHL